MRELRYFLGIKVLRSQHRILLNQRNYGIELISEIGLSGAKPENTPLEANVKHTYADYDKLTGKTNDLLFDDVNAYPRLVGKMIYLTIT